MVRIGSVLLFFLLHTMHVSFFFVTVFFSWGKEGNALLRCLNLLDSGSWCGSSWFTPGLRVEFPEKWLLALLVTCSVQSSWIMCRVGVQESLRVSFRVLWTGVHGVVSIESGC